MPLVDISQQLDVMKEVLDGRRQLFHWGAGLPQGHFYHWQCPFPVAGYVDTNWHLWAKPIDGLRCHAPTELAFHDPDHIAVAVHYHLGRTFLQVRELMDTMPHVPFFVPVPLASMLAAAHGRTMDVPTRLLLDYEDITTSPSIARQLLASARPGDGDRLADLATALRHRSLSGQSKCAVLFIEQINLGGAERQICNLAVGLRRIGWQVTVTHHRPTPREALHYIRDLLKAGVAVERVEAVAPVVGKHWGRQLSAMADALQVELLWRLPAYLAPMIIGLYGVLRRQRPELVVAYLDRPNVVAGMAATLAGIPRIVLSGRNLDPTNFPHFYEGQTTDLQRLQALLAKLPGISFTANGDEAANSYARWLGLNRGQVPVIHNGLAGQAFVSGPPGLRRAARTLLNLPAKVPLILGVFRLAPEKQPLLFLQVINRLVRKFPEVHAVICGHGPMEQDVRVQITELGLDGSITLLSGVATLAPLMADSTLLLHTSQAEGTPNVLLEAQAAGLPIVCVRNGSSESCLSETARGHTHANDDLEGLVRSCEEMLTSPTIRHRLIRHGRAHVRRHYSIARLVADTLGLAEGHRL